MSHITSYIQQYRSRLLLLILLTLPYPLMAATPIIKISIKNHLFYPSEISIPANTKVKLLIHNTDPTPEEFESFELNREKVISGNSKAIIFIGPLEPGEYPFFGEFFPKTAQGLIRVDALQ